MAKLRHRIEAVQHCFTAPVDRLHFLHSSHFPVSCGSSGYNIGSDRVGKERFCGGNAARRLTCF